ncbi:MAG: hypothetical protein RIC55_10280 [Pirellulaceae bacterium]
MPLRQLIAASLLLALPAALALRAGGGEPDRLTTLSAPENARSSRPLEAETSLADVAAETLFGDPSKATHSLAKSEEPDAEESSLAELAMETLLAPSNASPPKTSSSITSPSKTARTESADADGPVREATPPATPSTERLPPQRQAAPPESLPPPASQHHLPGDALGAFPPLPPDPYADKHDVLPPLEEELWRHGGSYLYHPEGDRLGWPEHDDHAHYHLLRLPEDWQKPQPVQAFSEFLGPDPIQPDPLFHWLGPGGYVWEPRFVGYGSYQLFGFGIEAAGQEQAALGSQLICDLDLRLTGTERFHVQFRPLGRGNTGGSYYQFTDPAGYVNNATGEPQRYWFEGELASMLGGYVDPFAVRDYTITAGKFPFVLQNALLMNDEILGVAINKNTIYAGNLSNINLQTFFGFNDVDTFNDADGQAYGVNAFIDYRRTFYELTYAYALHDRDDRRNAHFAAAGVTKLFGPLMLAGRAMFKIGDASGMGSGELLVLESNYTRIFHHKPLGVEYGVFYTNAFLATNGWSGLGGSNFNRLQAAFEVNPLVRIAAGLPTADTWGIAGGVQLFRLNEDESIIPEFAFEAPQDIPVWGLGLRYLRKTGKRSFFEAFGLANFSDDPRYVRKGLFLSETIVF